MLQSRRDDEIERLVKRLMETLSNLVDKRPGDMEPLYEEFFKKDRSQLLQQPLSGLEEFLGDLDINLIRPLAIVLYHDGENAATSEQRIEFFERSKYLFDLSYQKTGQLLLEDLSMLAEIDANLSV
ncbi:hypothetical protein SAMN05216436_11259 [bacterium A37T11]|nr:hypothetical protein SAMN05216436_11259 [bacterium A37T11]